MAAGLAAIAAAALYLFVTSGAFHEHVERHAASVIGRKTRIADVAVDWGWTARLRLGGVEVANAGWGKQPHMLKAEQVDVAIRLWSLLKGELVVPSLVLRKPEIAVEIGDKDQLNWSRDETPVTVAIAEAMAPGSRVETSRIGRIEVIDGRIAYRDMNRKVELDGTLATTPAAADDQPAAHLRLTGRLDGAPLSVRFTGGSSPLRRQSSLPYPLDLDIAFGGTRLTLKGSLQDPVQWTGANVDLAVAGPDLADLYPLLGIPALPSPPYRISGKLDREAGVWKLHTSKWNVGDSEVSGEVLVDDRRKPRFLTARLVSQKLVLADLAPLIGLPPANRSSASPRQRQTQQRLDATGNLFPDVPMKLERLRAMDADVTFDARRVIAPDYLPVQALAFRTLLNNGVATVKPLTLTLADGSAIAGDVVIDAQADTPRIKTALAGSNIELGMFFRNSKYADTTRGRIQGRISLAGAGKSVAEVMGAADGQAVAAMASGSVSSLMVSLAGLQLFDALVLSVAGDNRIPVLCALGRLNVARGVATFDRTLLDTPKSVLRVGGVIALQRQAMKVEINADPKSFDLLNVRGPVLVEGKIRQPAMRVGRTIPIPTPVFGDAKSVACEAMTRQLLSSP
ncbi:AsmA family protein [Vineibacter terrae]|uniref:AsmA family protein n=1 Tax=Vineibacter terrae TaxID=2586908 RepID=UPI002E30921F|nr:AsmA family protein [Vineibacter terrae]HEX2885452.1 AsmA family protein [Vineibacter terrae]